MGMGEGGWGARGADAVTKSKVLIQSSGTLLTHPTPPRTDFLWNLFKSHLSSAFYCISHIPHHKVTNHHTLHRANTTSSPFWRTGGFGGIFTFKVIKGNNFVLFVFSRGMTVQQLPVQESKANMQSKWKKLWYVFIELSLARYSHMWTHHIQLITLQVPYVTLEVHTLLFYL